MRLLLTIAVTTLALAACGQAAQAPVATVPPATTVVQTPTPIVISPRPTGTVLPSSVKSPTAAARAAFLKRLKAVDPTLVSGDADQRVAEGLDLCVHIAQGGQGQEIVLDAAIGFDVSIGEAAKVATATRETLCP